MHVSMAHDPHRKLSAVRAARTADQPDLLPSREEGTRLVRAFIRIRSPERRQSVLEYVMGQARMDEL